MRALVGRLLVAATSLIVVTLHATSVNTPLHPAHYLLLIDASGSTRAGRAKSTAYDEALRLAGDRLFAGGFKKDDQVVVPPYDPASDVLTVAQFGIVQGVPIEPYRRLPRFDLLRDLVHRRLFFKHGATREEALSAARPQTTYNLTLFVWAREIALTASAAPPAEPMNRIYLITVTDAEMNATSLTGERDMIRRSVPDRFPVWSAAVNRIAEGYDITGDGKLWTMLLGTSDDPIYIEASEVLPRGAARTAAKIAATPSMKSVDFAWTDERSEDARGVIHGSLAPGLSAFFPSRVREARIWSRANAAKGIAADFALPVTIPGSLQCEAGSLPLSGSLTIVTPDQLMGTLSQVVNFTATVPTPMPRRCTIAFMIWRVISVIGLLLIIWAIAYVIYYRTTATHVWVERPAMLISKQLRWKTLVEELVIDTNSEAAPPFIVRLPGWWLQKLFYPRAVLHVSSEPDGLLVWAESLSPSARMDHRRKLTPKWTRDPVADVVAAVTLSVGHKQANYRLRAHKKDT